MAENLPPTHPIDNRPLKKKKGRLSNLSDVRERTDSVRHSLCLHGHYHGLTPIRLPNGRLLWPID
jgi:Icc-related predicted phosphoesterase